jgi:hypothetical protein
MKIIHCIGCLIFMASMLACASTKEVLPSIGITVKYFGALGDGKTDDTAAIQRALDYAFKNKQGNPVILPSGGYVVSKPLVVPRNVDMIGEGLGFFSSLIPINCDALWIKGETQEGGYAFRNKIQNININMKRAASGKAIVIERAYNIKLADIFVYEAPEVGVFIYSAKHITIENVIIYGAGTKKGIGLKVSDAIVNMYNIDIENVAIALEIGPDKQDTTNVSVFGGFIERFGKYGINVLNSSHNTFIGLNIQADHAGKVPVNIAGHANAENGAQNKNNTFIGGFIGYATSPNKTNKTNKTSDENRLSNYSHAINVGE